MDERVRPKIALRLEPPQSNGYRYAVISLKNGAAICDRETDRSEVFDAVGEVAKKQATILAYLISDHWIGLILGTSSANTLNDSIQEIGKRCIVHLTARGDSSQQLGSCESVRLHTPSDMLAVLRHCHRFPVGAGIVADASDYRWSSHRAYLGLERVKWLTRSPIARILSDEPGGWHAGYRRLMAEPTAPHVLPQLISLDVPPIPISRDPNDHPCIKLMKSRPIERSFERIVEAVLSITACDRVAFRANPRDPCFALQRALIAWHATQGRIMSFSAVADTLGCDRSRLYKTLERFKTTAHPILEISLCELLTEVTGSHYVA